MVTINEFKISRICNHCKNDILKRVKDIHGAGVLGCETCNIIWQRGVNAAKNMMDISILVWKVAEGPHNLLEIAAANTVSSFEDLDIYR